MAGEVEEPEYTVLDRLGEVELRLYEPRVQATTTLKNSRETARGFRVLAGYIFGGNATGESIAMTAPVQETLVTDRPVMAFTMPAGYSMASLPSPDSDRVQLREVPERLVASLPFGGWATGGRIRQRTAELLAILEREGIEIAGDPTLNQYNPPWTPPFLRRNEIEVEIAPDTRVRLVRSMIAEVRSKGEPAKD